MQWLTDTLNTLVPASILLALLWGLAELWLKLRFSHVLAKELEDCKKELSDRDKASIIAEALAEWGAADSNLGPGEKKN